jgi:hypothetical protein
MTKISVPAHRDIVEDFAKKIAERRTQGKPEKTLISFRNDITEKHERDIYLVPIELLRYRKNNGRICSDVLSYERHSGRLEERSEEAQQILQRFLEEKDQKKTEELETSIKHDGQREPAIITCDGFLINGNRRKMVHERLFKNTGDKKFQWMKVVILPGKNDEGGSPTLLEIEQIENRYQLQSDGKAEYYEFDKALSMKRKIGLGMSLFEQLKDDPNYSMLPDKEFKRALKEVEDEFLEPLKCIDEYLAQLKRPDLYDTIATGRSDREGRWQAFKDYANLSRKLRDPKKRDELGVEEREIGKIQQAAFNLIRKREITDVPGVNKVHQLMRELPKWISNVDAKKEIMKLADLNLTIPEKDKRNADGKEHDERIQDEIWGKLNNEAIIRQLKKASHLFNYRKEKETPIELLQAALDKLTHENMDTRAIDIFQIPKAMHLSQTIQTEARKIEKELYRHQKNKNDLESKFNEKP